MMRCALVNVKINYVNSVINMECLKPRISSAIRLGAVHQEWPRGFLMSTVNRPHRHRWIAAQQVLQRIAEFRRR
jgi:hypothetical protein